MWSGSEKINNFKTYCDFWRELEERGTFSKKYHQELNKVKIEGRKVKHIKLRKHPDNSLCQCKASKDVSELEYTWTDRFLNNQGREGW